MSQETEFASKLANDHLAWVAGYNKALGLTIIPLAAAEYLYRTAMYHGAGHGIEVERRGDFRARIEAPLTTEEVAAISEGVLDLSLPSITLDCTAEEARQKWVSEVAEWREAKEGSLHELIEAWDTLQSAKTWNEKADTSDGLSTSAAAMKRACDSLTVAFKAGRPVAHAKRCALAKNAARNYYSEADNARILANV